MFSDHLQKVDQVSSRALRAVAAGLVISCQLIAMALVADGQVKKAQARHFLHASEQMAVASCIDGSTDVARNLCIAQAQASTHDFRNIDSGLSAQNVASAADLQSAAMPALRAPGFMPVSLGERH